MKIEINPDLEKEIRENAGDQIAEYLRKMAVLAVKLNHYGVSLDMALKYIREIAMCILKEESKNENV
jgi:hypothetical protein